MRSTLLAAAAVLSLGFSTLAFAAGGGSDSQSIQSTTKPADPNFVRAKAMIEAKDYNGALPLLQQVVAKDPRNADAYNLMGYATRKSGNPNGSLQYYQQALAIDPRHLGANEYIGEAYLMLNRPADGRAAPGPARIRSACSAAPSTASSRPRSPTTRRARSRRISAFIRAGGSRPQCAAEQRCGHAGQQRAAGAAQHEFAHARMAVNSHDDEIDIVIGGA